MQGVPSDFDVYAAAIWQDCTGEGQDTTLDLREAVYNVNPIIAPVTQQRMAPGVLAPNDPVATRMTFTPSVNGRFPQASATRFPSCRSARATGGS